MYMNSNTWAHHDVQAVSEDSCPLPIPERFTRYEKVVLLRYYINELQNREGIAAEAAYSQALEVGRNNPEQLKKIFCRFINTLHGVLHASSVAVAAQQTATEASRADLLRNMQGVGDLSGGSDQNLESLLSEIADSDEEQ